MNELSGREFQIEQAVAAAGGSSDMLIKHTILDRIKNQPAPSSIFDFGAGNGELISILKELYPDADCAAADYLERPMQIDSSVTWFSQDLNKPFEIDKKFELVVCSEVIEHLENPRLTVRTLRRLVSDNGRLILSMPNNESLRSYATLIFGGHYAAFLGAAYPAHITALLRKDLNRIFAEAGFSIPNYFYSNHGGIPKIPKVSWQRASFGLLEGRLFSDNVFTEVGPLLD